jgi:acyl carrier protein
MVPSVLVGLESFPLTASGKVDRRRLLEEYVRRATAVPSGESLSSTELRIAEIWKQVLQQRDIDADSHFFEIGGTSLTVFSVVHRLRSAFGLARQQLNDNAVYQYSTLRDLAGYVDSVRQGGPSAPAQAKIAVTLRKGRPDLPPLFVIASSGGTLGAYDRLSKALKTDREIVGIRDPYVWGARDPTMGFQEWIAIYVTAIRERQPAGPYYICAFSSAGAFGYEIAQHLRRAGQEVAQLLLIDPIGIAGEATEDFGYRVFTALFRGRRFKWRVRLEGAWRLLTGAGRRDGLRAGDNDFSMSAEEVERRAVAVRRDRKVIKDLSSLFELNAGLPFTLTDSDFEGRDPVRYVDILLSRVRTVTPDVDLDTVERILVQYYCLQLPATHFYRLKRYGGRVEIFEPASPQVGLLRAYFRPYAKDLRLRVLGIGEPSERIRIACANLSPSLQTHYRSMRDDAFVGNLAAALEPLLSEPLNAVGEVPSSP